MRASTRIRSESLLARGDRSLTPSALWVCVSGLEAGSTALAEGEGPAGVSELDRHPEFWPLVGVKVQAGRSWTRRSPSTSSPRRSWNNNR